MVELPWLSELTQGSLERGLSLVPQFLTSQPLLWPGTQLELVLESEEPVNVLHKVENVHDFGLQLVRGAEVVGVVLLESPHSGQSRKST